MDDLQFTAGTLSDLEEAHDASCDACDAIEALQQTALWDSLPIDTRRAICAARAHMNALAGVLAHTV